MTAAAATVARGLLDEPLARLLDRVGDDGRTPAGGSVAALAAALAAAVVEMAARNSSRDWPEAAGAVAQARALGARCSRHAGEDAVVLADALALLGGGGREGDLAQALRRAAAVPLAIASAAADVAVLAEVVAARGSADVRPDAAAAAALAAGAASAASHLVRVNLASTADDPGVLAARSLAAAAALAADAALALES